ncbi:hypothetical protein BJF79_14455 [Actinomadura sp. CNU-125]|uniref:CRISPR-associated endonuclease Cas2 n=1 Tax=Actinomadura sp. CNU-125 TaxID=1904961 RepID=UPI000969FEC0|nr:CRISPR-associated endonuclease Cas2 [Actinomadura sp. CNU-125]OLT23341.1 hypothetical protein BJF79_14455 [Actinomadura sp. CNU-125]
MDESRLPWLVTFDVGEDRARRAVHKALSRYGPRVLNTVYEIGAYPSELDRTLHSLAERLHPEDHLLALPRCRHCGSAFRGGTAEPAAPSGWVTR